MQVNAFRLKQTHQVTIIINSLRGLARDSLYLAATLLNKLLHLFVVYDEPSILGKKKMQRTQLYDDVGC